MGQRRDGETLHPVGHDHARGRSTSACSAGRSRRRQHSRSRRRNRSLAHGGNLGPVTLDGEQWRLFTSMFLHIGILHLVMNMIGLVDGGRHVEKMYGRAGFIALYLVSRGSPAAWRARCAAPTSSRRARRARSSASSVRSARSCSAPRVASIRWRSARTARGSAVFLAYNVYIGLSAKGIDLLAHLGGLAAGFVCGLALEYGTSEDQSTAERSLLVA